METKAGASIYNEISVRYGITNFFTNLSPYLQNTYFAFFLTTIIGVPNIALAGVLTSARSLDLLSLFVIGIIMQKSNPKMGRFAFWIMFSALITLPIYILHFTDLGLRGRSAFIFYSVFYFLALFTYNIGFTAYNGAINVLSNDPVQKVSLSAVRSQCNSLGKIAFSVTNVVIIGFFASLLGSDSKGYTMMAVVISVLITLAYFNVIAMLRGKEMYVPSGRQSIAQKTSLWDMIKNFFTKPMMLLIAAASCLRLGQYTVMGLAAYYFAYVAGDKGMLATYLTFSTLFTFGGSFISPFINKFLGSKKTYIVGLAVFGIALLLSFFFGKSPLGFALLLSAAQVGMGICMAVEMAIYGNVVEFTTVAKGKDVSAFLFSLSSMPGKIGTAISGLVLGLGLAAIGFDPKAGVTEGIVMGLRIIMSLLPAVIMALGIIAFYFFPLTDNKMFEIHQQAEEIKASAREAASAQFK